MRSGRPSTDPGGSALPADPDARGTRDRYREWARKWQAPELRAFVALETPADEDLVQESSPDGA